MPGHDEARAWAAAAKLFKLEPHTFEARVLARCPLSIRETADSAESERIRAGFQGCGTEVKVVESDGSKWNLLRDGRVCGPVPLVYLKLEYEAGRLADDVQVKMPTEAAWTFLPVALGKSEPELTLDVPPLLEMDSELPPPLPPRKGRAATLAVELIQTPTATPAPTAAEPIQTPTAILMPTPQSTLAERRSILDIEEVKEVDWSSKIGAAEANGLVLVIFYTAHAAASKPFEEFIDVLLRKVVPKVSVATKVYRCVLPHAQSLVTNLLKRNKIKSVKIQNLGLLSAGLGKPLYILGDNAFLSQQSAFRSLKAALLQKDLKVAGVPELDVVQTQPEGVRVVPVHVDEKGWGKGLAWLAAGLLIYLLNHYSANSGSGHLNTPPSQLFDKSRPKDQREAEARKFFIGDFNTIDTATLPTVENYSLNSDGTWSSTSCTMYGEVSERKFKPMLKGTWKVSEDFYLDTGKIFYGVTFYSDEYGLMRGQSFGLDRDTGVFVHTPNGTKLLKRGNTINCGD